MAAANYPECIKFTLQFEGGKVDDPQDPGGRTNQGVTQATYNAWRKGRGLAERDVYLMENSERDAIYKGEYWDKIDGDALPLGVDLATFDVAVNSGVKRALWFLDRAKAGNPSSETIALRICDDRMDFLRKLPTWGRFGKGWTSRVDACRAKTVNMARTSAPVPLQVPAPVPVSVVPPPPVSPPSAPQGIPEPSLKDLVSDWIAKQAAAEAALERIKAEIAK